jgi:hypothetical protein
VVEVDGRTVPTTPEDFERRHLSRGLTRVADRLWEPEHNERVAGREGRLSAK